MALCMDGAVNCRSMACDRRYVNSALTIQSSSRGTMISRPGSNGS
jgi:hypothetical protein